MTHVKVFLRFKKVYQSHLVFVFTLGVFILSNSISAYGIVKSSLATTGSSCSHELQIDFSSRPSGAYDLVCLKGPNGLVWTPRSTIIGNARTNSLLPDCLKVKIWSSPINLNSQEKKQFTDLAIKWFINLGLIPAPTRNEIVIEQAIQADKKNQQIGEHLCSNGIGKPLGVWNGFLPRAATNGWQITVRRIRGVPGNDPMFNVIESNGNYFLSPRS